jgi:Mrp family chromosome partitioning ATPase
MNLDRPDALQELEILPEAAFNAASKQNLSTCLENTRQNVLADIKEWADGDSERNIYWLKGMAGTGKSTIALTIAREYDNKGRLGASFFFSRGGGDLASVKKFAATIAAQLANISLDLKTAIVDAIISNRIRDLALFDQ